MSFDVRKIGITIILLSLGFGIATYGMVQGLQQQAVQNNCLTTASCARTMSFLNWTHLAVGILFSALTLGGYLTFFSKSEFLLRQSIKRLEEESERIQKDKQIIINEEKFNAILKTLHPSEQTILKVIKEHEGITQNTLRIKASLSKAKVSQALSDFAKKGLIRKQEKGKTYSVYLSDVL